MNNDNIFSQIQSCSYMYLASNPTLQCSYDKTLDLSMLRLYHIIELPSQDITMSLYAMENILDSMQFQNTSYVYIIQGTREGIQYYCGVVPEDTPCSKYDYIEEELDRGEETLLANFTVNYSGIVMKKLTDIEKNRLCHSLQRNNCGTILEGVPGVVGTGSNAVGINRFAQAMEGEEFILLLLAKPVTQQETTEITDRMQNVTITLTALQDYTKQCQQGSLCETALVTQGVNSVANATNNLTSGQLQFQLYKADENNPALEEKSLQSLEDAFFASDINNLSSLGKVFTTVSGIASEAPTATNQSVSLPEQVEAGNTIIEQPMLSDQIPNLPQSQIFNPIVTRTGNQNPRLRRTLFPNRMRNTMQQQGSEQINTTVQNNVPVEGELREISAIQQPSINNQLNRNSQAATNNKTNTNNTPNPNSQSNINSIIPRQSEENLLEEEFGVNGLQTFAFTNLSKTDTKTKNCTNTRTCTNQISETGRKNTYNTFTVTQKITNQAVSSWNTYITDLANTRLNYGGSRGVYVYTTSLFANTSLTLGKLTAAWRGMNMYDKLSKVPVKGFSLTKNDKAYDALVNFRLPLYYHDNGSCIQGFTEDEIIARSAYSQVINQPFVYGGNWISSKELSYMTILPTITSKKIKIE